MTEAKDVIPDLIGNPVVLKTLDSGSSAGMTDLELENPPNPQEQQNE
jgi:hypothetical protein